MHSPTSVFLVRPDHFGFNTETASTNAFQKEVAHLDAAKAMDEFMQVVKLLQQENIDHLVFHSREDVITPDAVFPNNWISILPDGTLILYPMLAKNRSLERNMLLVEEIKQKFPVKRIIDLTEAEERNIALEGTGSIVFDHDQKIAYACISPRTDEQLLNDLCAEIGYTPFCFEAIGPKGELIYHTNVVMNIGNSYAVVCLDAIPDQLEAQLLRKKIESGDRILIPVSFDQMNHFAGNMFEVLDRNGNAALLMSETAFRSLTEDQIAILSSRARIAYVPIPTIETLGGGSLRCMLAGIQIPRKR